MAKGTDLRRSNVVNALSSLKVYSLSNFPHFLHPSNALILNEFDDEGEPFTPTLGFRASYPTQLTTNINSIVQENFTLKLVEQKNDYLNEVEKVTGNYRRAKSIKDKKDKNKSDIHSAHLNHLMELTVSDPDPYFFGSYNWYYTGGVLDTASVVDMDFLFFVSGEQLNIFNSAVIDSSTNRNQLQLEHLDSTNQIVCDTIFEISASNDNRFVAARQKNKFTVFHLQDEKAHQDIKCDRNIPFMSGAAINDHLFTIDANRVIQRHDLTRNKESGRMYLKLPKNNNFWCQLNAYNNQLVFADEHKLKIYDSRLFGKKASKCMQLSIDSIAEKCDEITCIKADMNENNLYIATTHHLLVFDVRYGMESTNQLTRYTHQLKTPPLMIDASGGGITGNTANERLIAVSGTLTDDMALVQHAKVKNDKIRTNNLPRRVHSMTDTCRALRENGLRLEAESLQNRNRSINIGTKFIRKNEKLFLLSEKASGEIFYQELRQDEGQMESNIDDKPIRNVDFENERTSNKVKTKVTTVTNFDSIKRILNYDLPNDEIPDTENPQPNKWQQSIEQLQSYKDMLSSELLNVWQDRISIPINTPKIDRTDFVNTWINRSSTVTNVDDNFDDAPVDRSMF